MTNEEQRTEPTQRAIMECGKWLAWCLKIGWSKSRLNELEGLWWEHHDCYGNLIDPTE